jgi:hypothetical protein
MSDQRVAEIFPTANTRFAALTAGSQDQIRELARAIIAESAEALPWREMPSLEWTKRAGVRLYVFECAGFHKIGFSENPDRRLLDLQPCSPLAISRVAVSLPLAMPYAKWAEALAHHALIEFRERHEWFRIEAAYAVPIMRAAYWMGHLEKARDVAREINRRHAAD